MVEIVLNVVDRCWPILVIALIAASAIKAAIKPYSIADAPVSSLRRFLRRRNISGFDLGVRPPEYHEAL